MPILHTDMVLHGLFCKRQIPTEIFCAPRFAVNVIHALGVIHKAIRDFANDIITLS